MIEPDCSRQRPAKLHRRSLLASAAVVGAVSSWDSRSGRTQETSPTPVDPPQRAPRLPIIDTNINLFHYPFRRLPLDQVAAMIPKLRSLGIVQAWAGSFEAILHRDITGVNDRLAQACHSHRELVPIGSINPELPGWEADLRRCTDTHHMPGIRLHPSYHGYTLQDPRFTKLLTLATQAKRFVQIVVALEDTRTQHPLVSVPDVDLSPLESQMRQVPDARVQILSARLRGTLLEKLAATPGVSFDTSRVESTDGVAQLIATSSADRVLFGTHAPFLIPESGLIRVHESDLDEPTLRSILYKNAQQVFSQQNA